MCVCVCVCVWIWHCSSGVFAEGGVFFSEARAPPASARGRVEQSAACPTDGQEEEAAGEAREAAKRSERKGGSKRERERE